jgi:predicted lysophospholipase L1 biosynthesis ABC-type transport system permease subunit
MVKEYFPQEDPIGKTVQWEREDNARPMTIVGVVADIKCTSLENNEVPAIYTPFPQEIRFWKTWMNFVVRTKNPQSVGPAIRHQVAEVDQTIPVAQVFLMDYLILLGGFACLALLLASVGIYGVVSYLVNLRRHEVGVRLALGAGESDILKLILYGSMRLTALGLFAGTAASFMVTRILKNMLFGIGRTDPLTFLFVPVLLSAVALLASYIPARRAIKVDPVEVLRYQ